MRIIGGRWRGSRIEFPPVAALRPSPDRVRETLFNWLQGPLPGAACLDLFAGSGVLGLEALSRGAASVVFVDRDPRIARHLRETLARLKADPATAAIVRGDAQAYLEGAASPSESQPGGQPGSQLFDIVFLDPPFGQGRVIPLLQLLMRQRRFAPHAHVYIECEAALGEPALPDGYRLLRSKRAGEVGYHLALWQGVATAPATSGNDLTVIQ